MVGLLFLSKIKKKEVYLGKIAVGKITACNFGDTFHYKTKTKDL